MRSCTMAIMALLGGLALAGCGAGPHSGFDTQSFLGINQDIHSVFGTQNDYLNPLRINE
jgi:hypothetical protein